MPPVDEDNKLETAYDTEMLDCNRVAIRIALERPDSGGWLHCLCRHWMAIDAAACHNAACDEAVSFSIPFKLLSCRRAHLNFHFQSLFSLSAANSTNKASSRSANGSSCSHTYGNGTCQGYLEHKVRQPQLLISVLWHTTSEFQ